MIKRIDGIDGEVPPEVVHVARKSLCMWLRWSPAIFGYGVVADANPKPRGPPMTQDVMNLLHFVEKRRSAVWNPTRWHDVHARTVPANSFKTTKNSATARSVSVFRKGQVAVLSDKSEQVFDIPTPFGCQSATKSSTLRKRRQKRMSTITARRMIYGLVLK